MSDVVSPEKRSEMMSGIRCKNTKPEMFIRSGLHNRGYRFRLHDPRLPGKPDIVLPKFKAVIQIHGCFWHGHDCHLFKWPSTRPEFWRCKIEGNRQRDRKVSDALDELGWRLLVVWECALKGKQRLDPNFVLEQISGWLETGCKNMEIRGQEQCP